MTPGQGGCGTLITWLGGSALCDYQVGCLECMEASEQQREAWAARHGRRFPMAGFQIEQMRDADHLTALGENR